ncbi:hypothetical protein E2C01_058958 [Portunus trituberculatus]|uniref:Uncharacterized protein n=1 Tax=Portunus trituberculatus TaxID=210409 RepID=A0A5B7H4K2_PORTR|nr:hypothetical protein [Portunus trituberculatus]
MRARCCISWGRQRALLVGRDVAVNVKVGVGDISLPPLPRPPLHAAEDAGSSAPRITLIALFCTTSKSVHWLGGERGEDGYAVIHQGEQRLHVIQPQDIVGGSSARPLMALITLTLACVFFLRHVSYAVKESHESSHTPRPVQAGPMP